eukprot:GEZU01029372.1.p1 GENE.GEZU01029372.1~~GEZU01029372.1.p1  ORF type:complete len:643 (+),score=263.82 GEZU01029372.1:191-2119(+)
MNTPYTSGSLYIGDLHPDVTEALLFEIFREVGPVVSIRVCRDAVTRRSLGYAYVNFQNPLDAERALDTLNYTPVKERPMRIMWSHRDPAIRKSGIGNVFIKNLDKSIDNKALYDTFSAFGNILSCKVATDEKNQSKGYGFVHYETQEAAEQAIAKVNGMLLNDKKVYVGPFIRKSERDSAGNNEKKFTNVFIKNLDENVTEQQLLDAFGVHGKITKGAIMYDENGKSKGFGFVNYETPEAARTAVEIMNGAQIGSKTIWVGRAQKKAERLAELRQKFEQIRLERINKYQGVNLYIKNLDDTIDDERLRAEFSQFGSITSAKIMRDEKGISKGFGFVCYTTTEEATKAVTEMNGRMFGSKPIYVALAQRKEFRRAQLEAQHMQRTAPLAMRGAVAPMAAVPAPGMQPPQGIYPAPGVFYAQPGAIPPQQRPSFVYPGQMARPQRWGPQGPQGQFPQYPGLPGYAVPAGVVPQGQRPTGRGRRANPGQPGAGPQGAGMKQPGAAGAPGAPNARGNFKYNRNVRNPRAPEQQVAVQQMQQQPQGQLAAMANGQEPLSIAALANATPEEQSQLIGTRLYPLVQQLDPVNAAKITGMLLEMESSELLHLLESPEALKEKVNEANSVLAAEAADGEGAVAEEAATAAQ